MAHGLALAAGTPVAVVRACAREAEALGYRSFWVNHPSSVDGLAVLAEAARATTRVPLGIGVIPLDEREPASIAEGVVGQGLPLDRLWLGIGSPNPRALARVREGAAALRARLPVRVVVAALGPRMCQLAGEVGDAVLFNWLTPEHARRSAEWVRAGAAAAGRPVPRLLTYVRLALGKGAAERLRAEGARYAAYPMYAAHFERMGVEPEVTGIATDDPGAIAPALARWHGAVDEAIVRLLPAGESLDEHLAAVRAARPA